LFRIIEVKLRKHFNRAIVKLVSYDKGIKMRKIKKRHLILSGREVPDTQSFGLWKAAKKLIKQ
jgi:hypothetical protein